MTVPSNVEYDTPHTAVDRVLDAFERGEGLSDAEMCALVSAVAPPERREMVLAMDGGEMTTVDGLCDALDGVSLAQVYHTHVPALADVGAVAFDPADKRVFAGPRMAQAAALARLLDALAGGE